MNSSVYPFTPFLEPLLSLIVLDFVSILLESEAIKLTQSSCQFRKFDRESSNQEHARANKQQ